MTALLGSSPQVPTSLRQICGSWSSPLRVRYKAKRASSSLMTASKPNPTTDESELDLLALGSCAEPQSVKGVNLLTCLVLQPNLALPVAFELVTKPDGVTDKKTGKQKRVARHDQERTLSPDGAACVDNHLPFRYVLNDTWFASCREHGLCQEELSQRVRHAAQRQPQGDL